MTAHVFTEDQTTMEWYVDGIPVAELKRRYEAHDALVKALRQMTDDFDGCYADGEPALIAARAALAAAEVRNG